MSEVTNPTDLAELMSYIGARYQFIADNYPALGSATDEQREAFAVSHSVHHMSKSLGRLSAECESYDHGGKMNTVALKEGVVKMFINVVKLAEELNISAEELGASVPGYMRSN